MLLSMYNLVVDDHPHYDDHPSYQSYQPYDDHPHYQAYDAPSYDAPHHSDYGKEFVNVSDGFLFKMHICINFFFILVFEFD